MGAYSPSPLVDEAAAARIARDVFAPTVRALAAAGRPFRGLLYGGSDADARRGPMVIEWNCRFGDPETQAVLMRMEDDLLPWLAGAAERRAAGGRAAVSRRAPRSAWCWRPRAIPASRAPGDAITGLAPDAASRGERGRVPRRHQARRRRPPGHRGRPGAGRVGGGADLDGRPRARLRRHRPDSLAGHALPPRHRTAKRHDDKTMQRRASTSTWPS